MIPEQTTAASDSEAKIALSLLGTERFAGLDLFEQIQLEAVLQVCVHCKSLSEAGRRLFQVTRLQRSVVNDADRLRKYLHRYGLTWRTVRREA